MASLQHENILHVYDFSSERGSMYIVMEYVQGIDLYDLLEMTPRCPVEVAAIIALQVARALDYAHFRGIIHRDIKPANIMLDQGRGEADGLRHRARRRYQRPDRDRARASARRAT